MGTNTRLLIRRNTRVETNMVKETDSSPVIVLEEDCLNSKDLSNSLISRVKYVGSLSNLKKVMCNEVNDNPSLKYPPGLLLVWKEWFKSKDAQSRIKFQGKFQMSEIPRTVGLYLKCHGGNYEGDIFGKMLQRMIQMLCVTCEEVEVPQGENPSLIATTVEILGKLQQVNKDNFGSSQQATIKWIVVNEVFNLLSNRNRQILDGPFILNEIMQWCRKRKKQSFIFKVDFEKAYDSVRWDFLDDILVKFDFGIKWREGFKTAPNSSKGSIPVQWESTDNSNSTKFVNSFRRNPRSGLEEIQLDNLSSIVRHDYHLICVDRWVKSVPT
ncbi:hypothetical protein Tco_1235743 [Tanacetum coccineum]